MSLSTAPAPKPSAAPERVNTGIVLMTMAVFGFSLSDATAKWLGEGYSPFQIVFLRHVFGMLPAAVFVWRDGGLACLATRRPLAHALRAGLLLVAFVAFVAGLQGLPLAEAVAISFTAPLFITALSQPLLGEPVGPRRWGAVLVGFLAMLVMLRPGTSAFSPHALLILLSALAFALAMMLTRRLSRTETSAAMAVYTSLGGGLATLPFLPAVWQTPGPIDLAVFVVFGIIGGTAAYVMIAAHRHAPAVVLAPFNYTALVWAALIGWLVWREMPDALTWLGAAIIAAAGLYIAHREAVVSGRQRIPALPAGEA